MKRSHRRKPEDQLRIARERIAELFRQAESSFGTDPRLSDRYVEIARKISMKLKSRIPSELKKKLCKHCHRFLMPGRNCRVRTHEGKVVYYCLSCRKFMRFPYKRKAGKKIIVK